MELHAFPIPIPPPSSLSTRSLWVFPVHQARAPVSCIQPELVICFTVDNIHVLMLFSQNIPPSPSPTESKSLFCTSMSLRGRILYESTTQDHQLISHCYCLVAQSCLTFCNPMDYNPPCSSVHGISQAILEWVVISFSRGSFGPRDRTQVSCIGR